MWKDLTEEWKTAFGEAWEAFRAGNIPIGAAIYDEDGNLLIKDHNRTAETGIPNPGTAHAEANALRRLDTSLCNVRKAVLYTTMEPCPMCMGTAVMSNIRHLRYAARDPYCGCVYLKDTDPYISSKGLDYIHEGGEAEFFQLVIQSCHELRCIDKGGSDAVLNRFREISGKAVAAAEKLYSKKVPYTLAKKGADIAEVYDIIVSLADVNY
ncbi:MAG: nucleoside deaminase [Ruminococcus sp.]|nr:nucleoside deaminase [Ruminococcus sp.]